MKLLVIEGNIVIRNVIKKLISLFGEKVTEIYSVDNGTAGLGEIIIQEPDLIVIDSTLPDISVSELIEHFNENQRKYLKFTYIQPIFLVSGELNNLDDLYLKFDKSDPAFLEKLLNLVEKNAFVQDECATDDKECGIREGRPDNTFFQKLYKRICFYLGNRSVHFADLGERYYEKALNSSGIICYSCYFYWAILQIVTGTFLSLFDFFTLQVNEKNKQLYQKDREHFRKNYYPQFARSLGIILMVLAQLSIFLFTSIVINNRGNFVEASNTVRMTWPGGGWNKRAQLFFDNTKSNDDLIDFPVLIKLNSSRISYGETQNGGQDIRFTDSDGVTVIPHEIEEWNESGTSYVWVKVPKIDRLSNSDSIYIYYDNPGAPDGQTPIYVWGNNNIGVWHMDGDPSNQITDSTLSKENMKSAGTMDSSNLIQGISGKALNFGENDYLVQTNEASNKYKFAANQNYTISLWIQAGQKNGLRQVLGNESSSNRTGTSIIIENRPENPRFGNRAGFTSRKLTCCPTAYTTNKVTDSKWNHIVGVRNGKELQIYLNGKLESEIPYTPSDFSAAKALFMGNDPDLKSPYNGAIDEVRISDLPRSSSWIYAEYLSQTDKFVKYN